jgi:hypothetical protein
VVGALAGVLVRRRRPPPPLAQLLQPRLQTRGEANLLLITTCKQVVLRISFIKNAFFIFLLRVACLGRGLVVQLCCAIAFETDSNDSPLHPATSNLKMSDRSYLGKKKTLSRYHQQIKQQLEHKSSLNKFALLLHAWRIDDGHSEQPSCTRRPAMYKTGAHAAALQAAPVPRSPPSSRTHQRRAFSLHLLSVGRHKWTATNRLRVHGRAWQTRTYVRDMVVSSARVLGRRARTTVL